MTMSKCSSKLLCSVAALALLASLATLSEAATRDPFYIIAHMANSRYSLDWSVNQGANAIEADIKFDDFGNPYLFEHGGFCDCSCLFGVPMSYHICSEALKNKCSGPDASNDAKNHLQHIASLQGIAMLLIDSKVDAKWGTRLRTAGTNMVALLNQNLFKFGYKGTVVISAGQITCYDYVFAAAQAAASSPYKDRYYFSIDMEGDDYQSVAAMLSRFTKNRLFGTGISSCVLGKYLAGITQAVNGVRVGEIGMSYFWTLDKESSLETYINLGVQGIITNRVRLLHNLAKAKGLRLAKPGDRIPVATRDVASPNKCDCSYHKGGCTISFPPPRGRACKCSYKGFWTCGGSVINCNMSLDKCANPDGSKEACLIGGGDCGGYR